MVVVASGKTEENKGRGERLALLQGLGMGNLDCLCPPHNRFLLWFFLCEGEVHIGPC